MFVALDNALQRKAQQYHSYAKEVETLQKLASNLGKDMELSLNRESESQRGQMKKLRELYGDICTNEARILNRQATMGAARMWMESDEYNNENVNWKEKLRELHQQNETELRPQNEARLREKLREFDQTVWNVNHRGQAMEGSEDEELQIVDAKTDLKCPITKTILENPVRSTQCVHVFSRDAIYEMLKRKRSIKCPVAGCNQTISKSSLQRAHDTERELRQYQAREEKVNVDMDFTQNE
eukprot:CAMPEP_0114520210 /NCGR_PEP_ID=MMETSP0109-20121206/19443_1 /TAXON_ID=29199 /ORGANISM="Chlorarachnion reptans, Strain CCCM449" /LENGTH=239 /DNA_ID=CAMNT_0001701057 /DNA_START=188 /DNA_END=907 /DNA_ORIENTATION=-